jgi:hypothetical protein
MQTHLIDGVSPLPQDGLVLIVLAEAAERAAGAAAAPRRFAIAGPRGRAYRVVVCERDGEWMAALSRLARAGFAGRPSQVGMPLLVPLEAAEANAEPAAPAAGCR